jgi:hypothetical protein
MGKGRVRAVTISRKRIAYRDADRTVTACRAWRPALTPTGELKTREAGNILVEAPGNKIEQDDIDRRVTYRGHSKGVCYEDAPSYPSAATGVQPYFW